MGVAAVALAAAVNFTVVGDGIPEPLSTTPGDAARGRAVVVNRQVGLCLLCHSGPFPEERAQGNLAGNLSGTGSRFSAAQLRLRIADARRLNPASVMPRFHVVEPDAAMVARPWRGQPVLDAQQVEDVVAFLQTLR